MVLMTQMEQMTLEISQSLQAQMKQGFTLNLNLAKTQLLMMEMVQQVVQLLILHILMVAMLWLVKMVLKEQVMILLIGQ